MRKPNSRIVVAILTMMAFSCINITARAATNDLPSNLSQQEQALLKANPSLSKQALDVALLAYGHLRQDGKDSQQILSLVNYNKPDYKKRFWVINMQNSKVLYNSYVAQGKNTGLVYAKHFSNRFNSLQSSLGVFLTSSTYHDKHGLALRLKGLEKGINNNALRRAIIIHSAWYVSQAFVDKYHRVGRSFGCMALSKKIEPQVVKLIKDGTVLVGYYPDQKWLDNSTYTQPLIA